MADWDGFASISWSWGCSEPEHGESRWPNRRDQIVVVHGEGCLGGVGRSLIALEAECILGQLFEHEVSVIIFLSSSLGVAV